MDYRSRVDHQLRNFDVYDITCPVCMSVFQNPVIVCRNGHSLCSVCYNRYRVFNVHPDCPHCKVKMLTDPIVNRVAQCSVGWFFRTLHEIVPYSKDERVDLNLTKFINMQVGTTTVEIPPFVITRNDPWVVGVIQDIDVVQLEYIVVPDIRPDLLKSICLNNNNNSNAFALRIPFTDGNHVFAPYGAYSGSWRTLDWIKEHNVSFFYICPQNNDDNYHDTADIQWTTGIYLWDRKCPSTNTEWVLIGFEFQSHDGVERDVCWYDLQDRNIHPVVNSANITFSWPTTSCLYNNNNTTTLSTATAVDESDASDEDSDDLDDFQIQNNLR